ncbi:hypothetical protein D3C86_1526350 [compost metagenome]
MPIEEKHAGDVINADRTKTLTLLLNAHNAGELHYPHRDELKTELVEHLKTTKKIRERNADGDMVERFVKSSDKDHWVHSLNYAGIAGLALEMLDQGQTGAALPMVGGVRLGSTSESAVARELGKEIGQLSGLFGVSAGSRFGR